DLMAVVDRMCERPYVDSARTGVWGYSYGGFMTSWIIGHTDRFKAAVCGAPCFNLVSMYGTSDIGAVWGVTEWCGTPVDSMEAYRAHSPSTFAHKATTPTLIIHGEADERCPIGQGEEMYTALQVAGCEVEFARYPGGAHAFVRQGPPAQREDVINRVVGWFSSHLSGSASPPRVRERSCRRKPGLTAGARLQTGDSRDATCPPALIAWRPWHKHSNPGFSSCMSWPRPYGSVADW
ncbi:MAG: S9 family peptidase, partial [Candidatus Dormibacteraeota bacterium]|nr:S9 family peptidase [Candidatus Dormibacteraeota bacterium]